MPDKQNFDEAEMPNAAQAQEEAAAADAHAQNAADETEEAMPSAGDIIEKLNTENNTLKDKILREAAEMENLRKRAARDIADARAYAVSNFARDMLSVADNLGRALSAIPAGAREADAKLKSLAEGVEMTERAMLAALQNHGVRKIEALGQKFDPHLHQAVYETEDKSLPHNSVSQELQAGYVIGDRVLRAAQVSIAKGGEKAAPQKEAEAEKN